jgi:hypothetical protein
MKWDDETGELVKTPVIILLAAILILIVYG